MAFYVFAGSTPEMMFVAQTPFEALTIAREQSVYGHAVEFSDGRTRLTLFDIQRMAVAPDPSGSD